jgi:hypothetical protein
VRAPLARAVVQGGFDLLGLSQVGMSLEEIFLHLTTTDAAAGAAAEPAPPPEAPPPLEAPPAPDGEVRQ